MGGKVLEYEAKTIYRQGYEEGYKEGYKEGFEEGRILAVKIYQEANRNPDYTKEEIAEKVGCTVKKVEDVLKMFGM